MIIVFYLSHQSSDDSTELSHGVLNTIIKLFRLNEETSLITEHVIRKLAHFTLYTLGGILIYMHINLYNIKTKSKLIIAQMIGTIYAITDEIHQMFILGRTGEIRDILIDSAGVFAGIAFLAILLKMICKRKKEGSKIEK